MARRNWNASRNRALRHSRGTERAKHHQPFMTPLLARNTARPPQLTKAEMRAEVEAMIGDLDKHKPASAD
jgi:hypothetical protein